MLLRGIRVTGPSKMQVTAPLVDSIFSPFMGNCVVHISYSSTFSIKEIGVLLHNLNISSAFITTLKFLVVRFPMGTSVEGATELRCFNRLGPRCILLTKVQASRNIHIECQEKLAAAGIGSSNTNLQCIKSMQTFMQ